MFIDSMLYELEERNKHADSVMS